MAPTVRRNLPTQISSRQLNTGKNLSRTFIINNSTRKIETEKKKQYIKRISLANFFREKIIGNFFAGKPVHC